MSGEEKSLNEMFADVSGWLKEAYADLDKLRNDWLALAQAVADDYREDGKETRAAITLRTILESRPS